MTIKPCISIAVLMGVAAFAQSAMAGTWTATLEPAAGISGPAGSTIGWGYSITNASSTQWLVLENLTEDPLQNISSLDPEFDFPIMAPLQTVSEDYVVGTSGLLGLTWLPTAPLLFVNSGDFVFSADWYSGDPTVDGIDLGAAPSQTVGYTAQVSGSPSVPEPSSGSLCLLCLAGGGLIIAFRRRMDVR